MENTVAPQGHSIKTVFGRDDVKQKFNELLGKRSASFITSVLQIVTNSDMLAKADPLSVYHAAAVAATLDLPINQNLGFAYIIPFNQKQTDGSYKTMAQFQLGYKGFIQLAQRSGQFKTLAATPVYGGQILEANPLTGYKFDFTKIPEPNAKAIGYAAFFQLINGFEKTLYMSVEELNRHGIKYSQTYKKGYGLWKDDFDGMATKTVIKLLLSKFAPLSIEMQKAVVTDQAVINNEDATDVTYVDADAEVIDPKEKGEKAVDATMEAIKDITEKAKK